MRRRRKHDDQRDGEARRRRTWHAKKMQLAHHIGTDPLVQQVKRVGNIPKPDQRRQPQQRQPPTNREPDQPGEPKGEWKIQQPAR